MKVILMNKNTKVLKADIDDKGDFTCVLDIYNIDYAPLAIYSANFDKSKSVLKALNDWFKGRGIPSWRKDLEKLLNNLGINYTYELLLKSYGLSLSDCYWIKEENSDIKWENINFFDNNFEYLGYLEATYSSSISSNISLVSPNNTTDGMLSKAWIIDENKRKLMKGTYTSSNQEPINEYITSIICERLNIDAIKYEIGIYNNKLVSICDNCLNGNEEIISVYDLFLSKKKDNQDNDYEHYIKILEHFGLSDARKNLSDMYLIDYIMMNYDRHMKNYGVIRDVNTLKITRFMPIFDTGQSLCCDKMLDEINFKDGECKFFSNPNVRFSTLLKYINLDLYDLNNLLDIPDIVNETLNKYIRYTEMSEERIEKITKGMKERINYLITLKKNG